MTAFGKLIRTTAFRLTLVYLFLFALFAASLLGYFAWNTRRMITEQIATTVNAETGELSDIFGRRGHQIEIGARPQRPVLERENQSAQSAPPEDLADLAGFRVHRRGDLLGDQPARVPGEIAEQRGGKQCKQKQICQRQPERRGSDQLTECRHGSCPPRRESCEATAARSLCRSWNAAAKYARR